ncbi:hypothetical protein [Pseudoalteromonas sp. MMG022]|uniref:hypothetical protein n=1 Tax=Pseudoalteromonas sp. MMG022 TaxID=2909978 RepID=UPI001F46C1FF|nr:hypothetical protein [Pseudoalteromonas sp. MMG022]MCF6437592.1 hypothetical protein [Pseudoalteromonas sp. MMG022]
MEVRKIIIEALFTFNRDKVLFLRNFLPALVTLLVIGLGLYAIDIESKLSPESKEFGYIPLIFLCVFAFLVILAKSIVHTHRSFILSENASIKELFKLTRRDFRFIKKFIALNIVMMLVGIVIMAMFGKYLIELAQGTENQVILFVIGLITTLMTAFVWSRLSIVLPSAALDHSLSIQSAWKISDDYSAKLFIGVGLLPVVTDLIISYLPSFDSHIYTALIALVWSVVAIIEIGVLSLIYKGITEDQESMV